MRTADVDVTVTLRYHLEGDNVEDEMLTSTDAENEREIAQGLRAMFNDELGFINSEPGCWYSVTVDRVTAVANGD